MMHHHSIFLLAGITQPIRSDGHTRYIRQRIREAITDDLAQILRNQLETPNANPVAPIQQQQAEPLLESLDSFIEYIQFDEQEPQSNVAIDQPLGIAHPDRNIPLPEFNNYFITPELQLEIDFHLGNENVESAVEEHNNNSDQFVFSDFISFDSNERWCQ